MSKNKRGTTNALEILARREEADLELRALIDEERVNQELARVLRAARQAAGLTQQALADLLGTNPTVIGRLEDADYEGHSLSMIRRIAVALGKKVEIRLVEGDVPA